MSIPTLHRSRRARFVIPVVFGIGLSLGAVVFASRTPGPDAGPVSGGDQVAVAVLGLSETNPDVPLDPSVGEVDGDGGVEVGIGPAVVMERDGVIRSR